MKITTAHDICSELRDPGYSLVRADEILLDPAMQPAWDDLCAQSAGLPADEYLPGGLRYRFRRFGRFYFLPASGDLLPLPHIDYFQRKEVNKVTGGIVRKFAPLLPEMFANPFLCEIIRFNFAQFPVEPAERAQPWEVDVHLIRVVASPDMAGEPTPEGIHQDDAEFVTVHLAEFDNVQGGEVTIYDLDERPVFRLTLNTLLDSYFFADRRVKHSASAIQPADGSSPGKRSILTFDYHHRPELERPD